MIEAFFQRKHGVPQEARTVGGFQLDRQLTSTPGNVLYLARTDGGASLAVKIAKSPDPSTTEARKTEVWTQNVAANLSPGVVSVVAEGEEHLIYSNENIQLEGDFFYSATPYFREGVMTEWIPRSADANADARRETLLGRGLYLVCRSAAEFGGVIVNRDIKADNVLMKNKEGYIIDFGVATRVGQKEINTGIVFATPSLVAPEQLPVGEWSYDHRTDVWYITELILKILDGHDLTTARFRNLQPAYDALHTPIGLKTHLETRLENIQRKYHDLLHWGFSYYPEHRPTSLELYEELRKAMDQPDPPTNIYSTRRYG